MRTKYGYPYLSEMYQQSPKSILNWKFVLAVTVFTIIFAALFSSCNVQPARANIPELRVSQHFLQSELCCKHCGKCKVNIELILALEKLRKLVGRPIIITSGYRCPLHNREVGGAKNSQHQYGNAVDIKIKGYTPAQVALLAKKCGFTWEKVYSSWTHIDVRSI